MGYLYPTELNNSINLTINQLFPVSSKTKKTKILTSNTSKDQKAPSMLGLLKQIA